LTSAAPAPATSNAPMTRTGRDSGKLGIRFLHQAFC
jgi:hypothetical protein